MNRILLFEFFLLCFIRFHSTDGQSCPCTRNGAILQCSANGNTLLIDTSPCDRTGISSIYVTYNGTTVLDMVAPQTIPIMVDRIADSDSNILQIRSIRTNASRIDVRIYLGTFQIPQNLFTYDCIINAPSSILSTVATLTNMDPSRFKAFGDSYLGNFQLANYEFILNGAGPSNANISFSSLVYGLTTLTSITVIGTNQTLTVDQTKMPALNVNRLSLKGFILSDQILYNITNLELYSIQGCTYTKTSNFLNATPAIHVSMEMRNNFPLDKVLPFHRDAFQNGINLINLTLIEPRLNSTSLRAIRSQASPMSLVVELGTYEPTAMQIWLTEKPTVRYLTIRNIPDLNIFPSRFFNAFHVLFQTTLQGTFTLGRSAVCIFVDINRQYNYVNPVVILDSTVQPSSSAWDNCADTYVKAINYKSMTEITCPGLNTCDDCEKWAKETEQCNFAAQENGCPGNLENPGNVFRYNNSYLFYYFQNRSWLIPSTSSRAPPIWKQDSINIGAIIGAVCGLVIAAIILAVTIYCIYRKRQKRTPEDYAAPRIEQNKPSSHDTTHVSIATSKSSQSSRYALERSFFPVVQESDEIAPPLYTAPSESVATTSAYNAPSAPPAPSGRRDSVSTRATHVYETLDP